VSQLTRGSFADISLSLLRAVTGFLFFQHGAQKVFGLLGGEARELFSLMWVTGLLEFFGGLAILAGLYTRPVAFVLSGLMAVAYFWRHMPGGFWTIENRGELAMLYCFVFFFLFAIGGGSYSVDTWLRKKR
jgi:putative oxidoreductase